MDHNQDNFNLNPQSNNNMAYNNQNEFTPNINEQQLNVMPQTITKQYQQNEVSQQNINTTHQFDASFINAINRVDNNQILNQNISMTNDNNNEINQILNQEQTKFINNNIGNTNTALNDLNVDVEYNNMSKVDYSQDPQVIQNLNKPKKNTITITSEGKVFIIIIIVLLLFIFVLPTIFDFVGTIKHQ